MTDVKNVSDVPSKPGTPEVVEVTDTFITLIWKTPDSDGNTPIVNYIIEYHDKSTSKYVFFKDKINT